MEENQDPFYIKKNFTALALFIVAILLIIDIILRVRPDVLRPEVATGGGRISAVGYHQQFEDGSYYFIYTIFENNGDVYQCWWDENEWRSKKVTNYKRQAIPDVNK